MSTSLRSKICKNLILRNSEYDDLIHNAPARYKVYKIPKKNNSSLSRTICQPAKELKLVQRHLITHYLEKYSIHPCAEAYVKKKSAYTNSKIHASNPYIIKLDFKKFFNSITISDLKKFLKENNINELSNEDISQFCRLVFWHDIRNKNYVLSIGAPSSPIISNIILNNFDAKLHTFSNSINCLYTRYADDITISGSNPDLLNSFYDFIINNLNLSGIKNLEINENKTKFLSKKGKRIVTGFILSNDGKASLGREKKRLIRSMIHRTLNNQHQLDQIDLNYLKGILGHIKHFDHTYMKSLEKTYGEDFFKRVLNTRGE